MEYAPSLFKALNGVFCIYKPAGRHADQVIHTLQTNLARELNRLPCRPARERVIINNENLLNTTATRDLPIITTVPDLSDHPLVVGPRYIKEDFPIQSADCLSKFSSGVQVVGIGNGSRLMRKISRAQYMRVYHVKGQLGLATQDFTPEGRVIEKSTYDHINRARIDRVMAGLQAGHQKHMYLSSGIDLQSQEAYDMACRGLIRPVDRKVGPVIYCIRCFEFNPPHFTLEIHSINETCSYLMKLVHEIGLELRSNAVCTQVRRIRYGHFTLVHALLMKHCNAQMIVENINFCRPLLADDRLEHKQNIVTCLADPAKDRVLIESGKIESDLDL